MMNYGSIEANGTTGGDTQRGGGSSGGGSINIFCNSINSQENIIAKGGDQVGSNLGGAGGNGTVTIGNISTGTFIKN